MMDKLKVSLLGLCVYFCHPLFQKLAPRWYPKENHENSKILLKRFWCAVGKVFITIVIVLSMIFWVGNPEFDCEDYLRVIAAFELSRVPRRGAVPAGRW